MIRLGALAISAHICLTSLSGVQATDNQKCSVVTLPTWHNRVVNRGAEDEGTLRDVFNVVMKDGKLNWEIAKPMPWRRALAAFGKGEHAAAMPVLETKERRANFLYIGPVAHFISHYIENSEAPKNNVLSASRALQGVENYQAIIARFDDVVWSENFEDAWRMFERGRAQYTLMPGSGVPLIDKARKLKKYIFDPIPSRARPMYMMIHKNSDCIVDLPVLEAALKSNRLQIDQ